MFYTRLTYLSALLILVAACQSARIDNPVEYGEITIALTGEPAVDVVAKADPSISANDCAVSIWDAGNSYVVEEFKFSGTVSKMLPFGTYYVTAENCTVAEAQEGNGCKRVAGKSADVTIDYAHLINPVSVSCEVTNARVAVKFDASTSGKFPLGLQVMLKNAENRTLIFPQTAAGVETVSWFNPTSQLEYTISGTYSYGGITSPLLHTATVKLKDGRTNIIAKDNILIEVKVDSQSGQLTPTVDFNTDIIESTQTPGFNPY